MRATNLMLFAAMTAVVSGQPRPLEGNPGNVFLKGQEVAVKISASEGAKWICVDYEGKTVAEGMGTEAKSGKPGVGYYEIWRLANDATRQSRTTLAVIEPLKVPVPEDTPIALDTAAAWFFRDERKPFGLGDAANLAAIAGVGWTRDRLSWKETEPEKGRFTSETIYDKSAAAFAGEGLKVLQVFHETPGWAGTRPKYFPDDLRDVYTYLKTMSARWKGKVNAWEPWNEGDTTHFGGHTGAEMMAYQRAAYHGIRAGNPAAIVCQNVFAQHHRTAVLDNFIENFPADGNAGETRLPFDTFNFHHYIQPARIPASYEDMRKAANTLPIWVTESFFHFRQGVKNGDLDLTEAQRKERARFLTTNLVTALNEGPEKFFTFLLPHYVESGVLFGMLNADGTPKADYVALAAAGRLLAGARTSGKLKGEPSAFTFNAKPDGESKRVVVLWSSEEKPLPQSLRGYEKAYDFLGRETAEVDVGLNPVYLVFPLSAEFDVEAPVVLRPPEKMPVSSLVVQAVFPPERLRLANSSWFLKLDETPTVPLRIYHFGDRPEQVSVKVHADPALKCSLSLGHFNVSPEGRADSEMRIGWSGATVPARPMKIKITASADGQPDCTAVLRISTDMESVKPVMSKSLPATKERATWKAISSKGVLNFEAGDATKVSAMLGEGDRWVYPWHSVAAEERPESGFDGVAFRLTPRKGDAAFHVMLREQGGANYIVPIGQVTADGRSRRVLVLFEDFYWANFSPEDKNRRLDVDLIEGIAIGGNPRDSEFSYEVSGIEWVKFSE